MRGKPIGAKEKLDKQGITPAHAGKTDVRDGGKCDWKDHPRACGENAPCCRTAQRRKGSPPRMRGKPGHGRLSFVLYRITPAHAGKTITLATLRTLLQDHPRACGENPLIVFQSTAPGGSPPRMRGKRHQKIRYHYRSGITPAHAGKTQTLSAVTPH